MSTTIRGPRDESELLDALDTEGGYGPADLADAPTDGVVDSDELQE